MSVDLDTSTASEVVAALRDGVISSVELLHAQLERIEQWNPIVNAVVAHDVERARQEARAADDARARGDVVEAVHVLHGLLMTVKDSFETEGLVTTSGAPELRAHVPSADAALSRGCATQNEAGSVGERGVARAEDGEVRHVAGRVGRPVPRPDLVR